MKNYFGELDRYLFHHGTHYALYEKMGAHFDEVDGVKGVRFVLWAPNALKVSVCGDFKTTAMTKIDDCIWEAFIPHLKSGVSYKYAVLGADNVERKKADPFAFYSEVRPQNSSRIFDITKFVWSDDEYKQKKSGENFLEKPLACYEVHLGSWKRENGGFKNYRDLAVELCEYVTYMGYTHIELMGILEHPLDASWGYQVTGYFSPTSRHGSPEDFMFFVDYMHAHNIGVILDWVPAHFPKDEFGLATFDGTPQYEYANPLRAEYPQWGTKAFDLSKPEVSNFLIASAFFWVNVYHIDAIRADAVASMLYNSFCREKFFVNPDGTDYNYESFAFFRHLNSILRQRTDAYIIAEDSSILEGITKPARDGGFGFGLKWDMGWMNDTIKYYNEPSIYRRFKHNLMTGTFGYVFLENYILVLSHDEVVHGKGSMFNKMSGDLLEKYGSLKTAYTMMFGHPGKKLLFMGGDFGQEAEWDFNGELQWHLLKEAGHYDIQQTFRKLLHIYSTHAVLYNDSGKSNVFEWIDGIDSLRNTFSFIRRNPWNYNNALIFVCNFCPVERQNFVIGVPLANDYVEIFSTYGDEQNKKYTAKESICHGRKYSISFTLRAYESKIIEIPFVESTEMEKQNETIVRKTIKEQHEKTKATNHNIPKRDEILLTKTAKLDGVTLVKNKHGFTIKKK